MQNVLLRVTHYERGAERIVSARPVILYIANSREATKGLTYASVGRDRCRARLHPTYVRARVT